MMAAQEMREELCVVVACTEIDLVVSQDLDSNVKCMTILPKKIPKGEEAEISFLGNSIVTFPCYEADASKADEKLYITRWKSLFKAVNVKTTKECQILAIWLDNFDFLGGKLDIFVTSMIKALCMEGKEKTDKIGSLYVVAKGEQRFKDATKILANANRDAEKLPRRHHQDTTGRKLDIILTSMIKALCMEGQEKSNRIGSLYVVAKGGERFSYVNKILANANRAAENVPLRYHQDTTGKTELHVEVVFGKLHEQKHDVLVNTASPDLDFSKGIVSHTLLAAAGDGMQREAYAKYKKTLHMGQIAKTGGHNLLCKKVLHVVLYKWEEKWKKDCCEALETVVSGCLYETDKMELKSIAFPALGTGRLSFPTDVAAKIMFTAIASYMKKKTATSIERVTIVIYDDDNNRPLQKVFQSELLKTFPKANSASKRNIGRGLHPIPNAPSAARTNEKDTTQTVPQQHSDKRSSVGLSGRETGAIPKHTLQGNDITNKSRREKQRSSNLPGQEDSMTDILDMMNKGLNTESQSIGLRPNKGHDRKDGDEQSVQERAFEQKTQERDSRDEQSFQVGGRKDEQSFQVGGRKDEQSFQVWGSKEGHVLQARDRSDGQRFQDRASTDEQRFKDRGSTDEQIDQVGSRMDENWLQNASDRVEQMSEGVGRRNEQLEDYQEKSKNRTQKYQAGEMLPKKENCPAGNLQGENGVDYEKMDIDDTNIDLEEEETSLHFLRLAKFRLAKKKVISDISEVQWVSLNHFFYDGIEKCKQDVAFKYKDGKIVLKSKNCERLNKVDLFVKDALNKMQDFTFCPINCENIDMRVLWDVIENLKEAENWDKVCIIETDNGITCVGKDSNDVVPFMTRLEGLLGKGIHDNVKFVSGRPMSRPQNTVKIGPSKDLENCRKFQTPEGITIYVYQHSILAIETDCIVSTANSSMEPVGKTAKIIADAAGQKYKTECQEWSSAKRYLTHGLAYVTTAVDLEKFGYQCVIHTVGPGRHDYDVDVQAASDCLRKAVYSCLLKAGQEQCRSIGIPSISAGNHGMPKKVCATQYCMGVLDYSATKLESTVKEIHFVDVKQEMIEIVKLMFASILEGDENVEKKLMSRKEKLQHQLKNLTNMKNLKVNVKFKKERQMKKTPLTFHHAVDMLKDVKNNCALVCGQQRSLDCQTSIAKQINEREKGQYCRDLSKKKEQKQKKDKVITEGEVLISPTKHIHYEKIYTVVVPSDRQWTNDALEMCYKQVLQKAAQECKAVGFHLLGLKRFPVQKSALCLCKAVLNTCKDIPKRKLTDVYIFENKKQNIPTIKQIIRDAQNDHLSMETDQSGQQNLRNKPPARPPTRPNRKTPARPPPKQHPASYTPGSASSNNFSRKPTGRGIPLSNLNEDAERRASSEENLSSHLEKQFEDDYEFNSSDDSEEEEYPYTVVSRRGKSTVLSETGEEEEEEKQMSNCPICMDDVDDAKVLEKCGHVFCNGCISEYFKVKPVCPICGIVYGALIGNQPDGEMKVWEDPSNLPGYTQYGTIRIEYRFRDGIQSEGHPCPGQPYKGTRRVAYLPDSREGRSILHLLKKAWDQKLVFTIGRSVTTGEEGVVTWKDIHHKTKMSGGIGNFGYPDPTYLSRVREELAAKGITDQVEETHV